MYYFNVLKTTTHIQSVFYINILNVDVTYVTVNKRHNFYRQTTKLKNTETNNEHYGMSSKLL